MDDTKLLYRIEVVRALGIGRTTFYRWDFDGHGPQRTLAGQRYLFAPVDILRWVLSANDVEVVRTWLKSCRHQQLRELLSVLDEEHATIVAAEAAKPRRRRAADRPENWKEARWMLHGRIYV